MNEMPMNIKELKDSLIKLSHELDTAVRSIKIKCEYNFSIPAEINDLHLLNELVSLASSLTCLSRSSGLKDAINEYCRWLKLHRKIHIPDELDDKAIYSLYLYRQKCDIYAQKLEPASEIAYALYALSSPTPPLCHVRSTRCVPRPIEFKNGKKLLFHKFNVPNCLEDFISSDNVVGFCLGIDIRGKKLSEELLRCLMQNRCVNILEYLIRTNERLPCAYPPENLLLTVLYEMDGCPLLPVIKAIEETFPGTIKFAEDASHRNAFWYTLRHHIKVLNVHNVNFCCATDIEDVEQYLLSKGCDPAKASNDRFSWQTMKRVINAIQHFETNG